MASEFIDNKNEVVLRRLSETTEAFDNPVELLKFLSLLRPQMSRKLDVCFFSFFLLQPYKELKDF